MTISSRKGFTLVETLFYVAGLLVLLGAIVTFLFYMNEWYRQATIGPRVDRAGIEIVDAVVKNIRMGSVIRVGSVMNSDNGTLTMDGYLNGLPTIRTFALGNGRVTFQIGAGFVNNISPSGMTVSRLRFASLDSTISKGIRVDVDITFDTRSGTSTKTFSGFAVMRHSYE